MATLQLKNINKIYDNKVQAVFDFNLDIAEHEFIVFVGPSGCGKSITLRMIAGLEDISSGELYINGQLMNDVQPKDRDIAMVFQSYALYPHMTVYDNMAFALTLKKMPKAEIDKRVHEAAEILELTPYLKRKPKALSGGQRQRVALGRAIVRNAKVFLMDEPLSNLDAKLRVQMRAEIIRLHNQLNATTIYVTHDQTEAMTMASRIVVMKDGHIQQVGTPREIYEHPSNLFVASFIGAPAMNFLKGTITGEKEFTVGTDKIAVPDKFAELLKPYQGKEIVLGIRPEDLRHVAQDSAEQPFIEMDVDVAELLGAETIAHGKYQGQEIVAKVAAREEIHMGSHVKLAMDIDKIHFYDPETTKAID